jgi:hypothetical protein
MNDYASWPEYTHIAEHSIEEHVTGKFPGGTEWVYT